MKGRTNMLRYPISAFIEITSKCNLRCVHCYNNSGICDNDMDFNFIIDLLDDFERNDVVALTLSGGEPLLYSNISKLLCYIKDNTSMRISLNTNGILLNDQRYIDLLLKNEVRTIQISLDGNREMHDFIRGKGTYIQAIKAIKKSIAYGIEVRIGYTVNALNYNYIEETCGVSKEIGASSFAIYRYIPSSNRNGHKNLDFTPVSLYEAAQKVLFAYNKYADLNFRIYYENLSFFMFLLDGYYKDRTQCLAGVGQINIDCACNMSLCAHLHNLSDNLLNTGVGLAWESQKLLIPSLQEIPMECKDCIYASICKGGCKGISYILTKTFNHKDECCYKDLIEAVK